MSRLLDDDEIRRALVDLPGWLGDGERLTRTLTFPSFMAAVRCIDDVADDAESMDHHPDIDLRWRTLRIELSTHSASGVTQLDVELAHRVEAAAARHGGG